MARLCRILLWSTLVLQLLGHCATTSDAAVCITGLIRPGMLQSDKFARTTASFVSSIPNSTCFIYLEIPEVIRRMKLHTLLNSWIENYRHTFEPVCTVRVFDVSDTEPHVDRLGAWECDKLKPGAGDYGVGVRRQTWKWKRCLSSVKLHETERGHEFPFLIKVRTDTTWERFDSGNIPWEKSLVFSANRNPPCGFGGIDWVIATPRRYADNIFGILDQPCPADAMAFEPTCSQDVAKCFGLECFLMYTASKLNVTRSFLPPELSPLPGHWQGFSREFSCGSR